MVTGESRQFLEGSRVTRIDRQAFTAKKGEPRGQIRAMTSGLVLSTLALSTLLLVDAQPDGHAHSFQHFHGPVMGDDSEVTWNDDRGHHHEDYVAQPRYDFSYGVEDHRTGDYHGQKEHRDGTDVYGEYTVKEPDGNIRTVTYRAGEDGFHAQVHNSHRGDSERDAHHHHDHH